MVPWSMAHLGGVIDIADVQGTGVVQSPVAALQSEGTGVLAGDKGQEWWSLHWREARWKAGLVVVCLAAADTPEHPHPFTHS